jgi:hypothetical protein
MLIVAHDDLQTEPSCNESFRSGITANVVVATISSFHFWILLKTCLVRSFHYGEQAETSTIEEN